MAIFEIGETVVCSVTVKNSSDTLVDPSTSMNIEIARIKPGYEAVVTSTAMSNDGVGLYHYDFQSADKSLGYYEVVYTATDGARISIQTDALQLIYQRRVV